MRCRFITGSIAALICLAGTFSARPLVAGPFEGVTVVASNETELILEIRPVVDTVRLATGELLPRVGSAKPANGHEPGAPLRLAILIPVGLPSKEGGRLEVSAVEYGPAVNARIAPVPGLGTGDGGTIVESHIVDEEAYARPRVAPPPAELRYGGIAREFHSGVIAVEPYRYDAATNTVRFLTSVRIRLIYLGVTYQGGGRRHGSRMFAEAAFLNGSVAVAWAIGSPSVPRLFKPAQERTARATARAWMRVEVKEEGLYELREDDFRKGGIDPATVDPGRIAIYGGDGGDLPEDIPLDITEMRRIPARVETDGGKVSRVLFYGVGPIRWSYPAGDTLPRHALSPYVHANSYIVAVDGAATFDFPRAVDPGPATVAPTTVRARHVYEEDLFNAVALGNGGAGSGRGWFGPQIIVGDGQYTAHRIFTAVLPGVDQSQAITYRLRFGHNARIKGGQGEIMFQQAGVPIASVALRNIRPGSLRDGGEEDLMMLADERTVVGSASALLDGGRSDLKMIYRNSGFGSAFLDFYELHYDRDLAAVDNEIAFESPVGSGIAAYAVRGFGDAWVVGFDVTDPTAPRELARTGGDGFSFRGMLNPAHRDARRYFIVGSSRIRRVSSVASADYAGLRERSLDADLVIITHKDLKASAERLAAYRNAQGKIKAAVVTTDAVYTEFSHGNLDPTAIRDFLAHAMRTWERKPTYALLIGDGTYDYRNISTGQPVRAPTFETDEKFYYDRISSSAYDDYFAAVVGDDALIDLVIARIPAMSAEQVEAVIDKIERYERADAFGRWRQTVVMVADNYGGISEDFQSQSEDLWSEFLPDWIEPKKIYLGAYPSVSGVTVTKPAATQDLLAALTKGAVITNWVGHGNPNVWAAEAVLAKDAFIPKLKNDSALTMLVAVTCNFGRFDDPTTPSGAEEFLLRRNSGAVAALATTRGVYIDENAALMRAYFSRLFQRDPVTLQFMDIGHAMLAAKLVDNSVTANERKYILFGDPTMRLNLPSDSIAITRINGIDVGDSTVTLQALSRATVEGRVMTRAGTPRDDFNGSAILTLFDVDRTITIKEPDYPAERVVFYGGQLYNGRVAVTDGKFIATFYVPKDISFSDGHGRLHAYAFNDREDASGATVNLRVFGIDTTTVTDGEGPEIRVFLNDRSFRSGDVVTPKPLLMVDLIDGSGINASGAGLGHRIEAWIDGSSVPIDLTDTYESSLQDDRTGTVQRVLADLKVGEHTARVRGWDIFNNPAEATVLFKTLGEDENEALKVVEVVNYPNPMSRTTEFCFRHNQAAPLDVDIEIFTVGGRKIRRLEGRMLADRFVRVGWDGTDQDGDLIGAGVYYYRLRVRVAGDESKGSFETIEKVVVMR